MAVRFNRLTAAQLDECLAAFGILEKEGIGRVQNMDSVSLATTALARHGVATFDSPAQRDSLKASAQQALSRQGVKDVPAAPANASGQSSGHQEGTQSAQKADVPNEEDVPAAPASASGQSSGHQEGTQSAQKANMPDEEGQKAADLYNQKEALVKIVDQGDIKLISGEYLVEVYEQSSAPVQRHQDLPERAFVRHEELLKEGTEIVAISYCWCSKEHPDPDRFHLPAVAKMVKAMLAGKFSVGGGFDDSKGDYVFHKGLREAGYVFGASAVAVLWDYMSLPQVERSETELATFKRGLKSMNAWYGSRHVTKLILTDLPHGAPRASYQTSGWTCFEREVANVVSPPWRMQTLARGNSAYEKLFAKDSYFSSAYVEISYHASQAGNRSGPMVPEDFDVLLDTLTFTSGADKEVVRPKYRECFSALVTGATSMSLRGYDMSTETAEQALKVLLAHVHHMEQLDLASNAKWKLQLETFVPRIAAWASSLMTLDLYKCREVTGDVRGLAPLVNLHTLNLSWCKQVSGDVMGLAPLVKLIELDLTGTQVSGDVMGLAPLLKLEQLYLSGTQVRGDVMGLAPLLKLQELNLRETQVSGDVMGLVPLLNLQRLLLSETQVSGDVMGLAPLLKLQQLNLFKTQVSGDVMGLAPLVELKELMLSRTQVVGDFDALKKQLPKLQIYGL